MHKTLTELRDEKAAALNRIDDILGTAKAEGRPLTDEERAEHDALVALIEGADGLDVQIRQATLDAEDQQRFAAAEARKVPNIATRSSYSVGAGVTRNLDELLYATADHTRASNGAMNPVEQVLIRSGDSDVLAPRLASFRVEDRDLIRAFQAQVADMCLFGLNVDRTAKTSAQGFQVARGHRVWKDRWQAMCRALDVDTAAEGTEWVPTGIGASLHEQVRASGKIAPLFARINLPTNPWKWPVDGADAVAYRVAEPTSDTATKVTASTPGTAAATFDAEILGARVLTSRSLEADSVLAILPWIRNKLVQAFVDAEERAILDGDADGTHQDSDTHSAGSTDAAWSWDGLRKKAIANTVVTATTSTVANLLLLRAGMTRWGINPADLVYIVGVSAYHDLLGDSNLLTVDKLGPQATILSGQVGSIAGVPVVVSQHVRENLNASGVYDGITTTKTYNLCVNRGEWALGQRMGLDVEVDDSIYREAYQRVMVGFMREDFQHIGSAAGNEDTAISYNVTP